MVDRVVGREVQMLVCLFPVYHDLQATVLFADNKGVQERDAAFELFLLGELKAPGVVNRLQVFCQLLNLPLFDDFQDVIHISFPQP